MSAKRVVTLNIEPNEVRLLVTEGRRITHWGSVPLAEGLIRHGIIADSARISKAIESLFEETDFPRDRVAISLTGMRSLSRMLTIPKLKSSMLAEAIQYEAEREMPVPLDELYLSWEFIGKNGVVSNYCIFGVPRDLVDMEIKTLAQADIQPRTMYLKPLALARAVNRKDALIIDMEPKSFDIVAVVGGMPVIMRTIMSRSDLMTTQDRIDQLKEELSRTIQFYNSSNPDRILEATVPAFLTGSLAEDPDVYNSVTSILSNPIEDLDTLFDCPSELSIPLRQYAVNIGLAMGGSSSRLRANSAAGHFLVVNPNVLPEEYKPEPMKPRKLLIPAMAMFLAVLMIMIFQMKTGADGNIKTVQDELNDVVKQLDEIERVTAPVVDQINDVENEVDRLIQEHDSLLIIPAPSAMADGLAVILEALPTGVKIAAIDETDSRLNISGNANTAMSVASYVIAIEREGMFSTVNVASLAKTGTGNSVSFNIVCMY